MRRLPTPFVLACLLGCAGARSADAQAKSPAPARTQTLTPELLVGLQSVADARLSPDGRTVAYTLSTPRALDDPGRPITSVWLVPRRGGAARRFSPPDVATWSPRWSPDGKTLAFLSKREGQDQQTQVYAAPIDGGEGRKITSAENGVTAFEWAPTGTHIAFSSTRVRTPAEKQAHEAGQDWQEDDITGDNEQLWRVDVASGTAHAVSDGSKNVRTFAWSPDGKSIAFQAADLPTVDHDYMYRSIYVVDAAGGTPRKLTETHGKLGEMDWSPDGRQIAFLSAVDIHDSTPGSVFVAPAAGGHAVNLTPAYEGTAQWVDWLDARTVVFSAHESTETVVRKVSAQGGAPTAIVQDAPTCRRFDTADDRRTYACAGSRATHPGEVFTGAFGGREITRLTVSNPGLEATALGEQKVYAWKAADGVALEGIVILPVGWQKGKRYPLVVLPHGGPEGISLHGWTSAPTYPAQVFASRGFLVFEPNYRGSSGRGAEFSAADHQDLGGKEFEDVLAGIDQLVAEGLVDPDRVGMGGWSYGGYFSGLAATKWSSRFKATMIAAAITNWISFTGTTEIEHENSLVHWKLWPYEQPALAWDRSPMAHSQKGKTPALIVHGAADTRVPPTQSQELFRALRHAGVDTKLVIYPREPHGLRENVHQLDFVRRFVDWFERHLQG